MRAIVTRPRLEAERWCAALRDAGFEAEALPLIDIGPPDDPGTIAREWQRLATRRAAVFVSPNAVRAFFAARPEGAAWPGGVIAAAPGPGSADALRDAGVAASLVVEPAANAAAYDSETLWQALRDDDWRGAGVVVVRGEGGGREWLSERLRDAGATVEAIAAYARRPPPWGEAEAAVAASALAEPRAAIWLFSSSEAIGHLEALAGSGRWHRSRAVASHARIAERARAAGFAEVREALPARAAVIACLQSMRP